MSETYITYLHVRHSTLYRRNYVSLNTFILKKLYFFYLEVVSIVVSSLLAFFKITHTLTENAKI